MPHPSSPPSPGPGMTDIGGQIGPTAEEPCVRSYFYVGGEYTDDGGGGHVFRHQMYVERLLPVQGAAQESPVVLIHGQAQTGTNFLNKPDGGRGWASDFLSQGYEVYLVDQVLYGRSGRPPGTSKISSMSAELIQDRFTATSRHTLWPQAAKHTQWPGTGLMGDPIFDAFYSANVQFDGNTTYEQTTVQKAGAALLDRIGKPAILVGHSQGGVMPLLIADARPRLVRGLILLEPRGPPFSQAIISSAPARPWGLSDIPMIFSPPVKDASELVLQKLPPPREGLVPCILQADDPPPRKLINLVDLPILLVTGEASYHATYDYCTAMFLRQAGCRKTDYIELGKVGIHGNGHLFFLEKNSSEIQRVLHDWIQNMG